MKNLLFSLAFMAVSMGSTGAFAVEMSRCPDEISAQIDGISPVSEAEIRAQLEDRGYPEDEPKLMELVDLLAQVRKDQKVTYRLVQKKHSQCEYAVKGSEVSDRDDLPDSETRFYTRNGTDVLRISLPLPENKFATVFLLIDAYEKTGIVAKSSRRADIYGYSNWDSDHRGARFKIGKAKLVSLR